MFKKSQLKWIANLLIITLIFSSIPLYPHSKAMAVSNSSKHTKTQTLFKNSKVGAPAFQKISKHELTSHRTANSEVIDNGDGTITKKIFNSNIHLKDKKNKWQTISTDLTVSSGNILKPENSQIGVEFNQVISDGTYSSYNYQDHPLSYKLLKEEGNGESIDANDVAADYQDNRVVHHKIFPSVDLRSIVFEDSVKEDLILNKFTGFNSFSYQITTDLVGQQEDNGSITFSDKEGKIVYSLPKPFMSDSNIDEKSGEAPRSDKVVFSLEKNSSGYQLKLTADQEWLKSSDRVYPVYIDPTTNINASSDSFVADAYPTTNYDNYWESTYGFYSLKVGRYDASSGTNYSYVKTDVANLKYAIVDSSTFKIYTGHSYYPSTATGVWLDKVNGSWSESSLTWNNKPSSTNIASDSVYKGQWANFNVTDTIKGWVEDNLTNYGFKLHANGNGQTYWKKFYSSENSTNKPYLSVTYHYPTTNTPTAKTYNSGSNLGYTDLNWNSVPGATGYHVWIFNGKDYESFNVGNVTSWSTKGKGIWPTAAEIAANSYNLHQDGKGTDLAEDPSPVYQNSGGTYGSHKEYFFRVSAIFSGGESATSNYAAPTIPNLNVPVAPDGIAKSNGDGTGYVDLNWEPVSGAAGYKVWIYNGKSYESFDVGNNTVWSTRGKKIWPTAAEISAGRYDLHQDGYGTELPLKPSPTYANSGTSYATSPYYFFRLSAYNAQGETVYSPNYLNRILPDLKVPDTPQGTAYNTNTDGLSGFVDLKWSAVAGATGYKVLIFNGKDYQEVNVGNVLSWSTRGKGIWPTAAEISTGAYQLHTDNKGTDLSVDPRPVYKNSGGTYGARTDYYFRVVAYNADGETYNSSFFYPNIPLLTDDLGSKDYRQMINLPKGSLTVSNGNFVYDSNDISLDGRGPSIDVTRTYNSLSDNVNAFGLGWSFIGDMKIVENDGGVFVTDADGSSQQYYKNYITKALSPGAGDYNQLTKDATTGLYTLKDKSQNLYHFGSNGKVSDITDTHGNTLSFVYNASNQLTSITDASGRAVQFTYNLSHIMAVQDPQGKKWSYNYSGDQLISVIDPDSRKTSFAYTNNTLTTLTEPSESSGTASTTFNYTNNKLTSIVDAEGKSTKLAYGSNSVLLTNPNNTQEEYTVNDYGNPLTETEDPTGLNMTTEYVYAQNLLIKTIDPKGNATSNTYDVKGNILTTTDPSNNKTVNTYDGNNNLLTTTDSLGNKTTNVYDSKGNLMSQTNALGEKTSYTYDSFGNKVTMTDPDGKTTTFSYDAKGNYTSSVVNPNSDTTTQTTDEVGNVKDVTDGNGNKTLFTYDARNLLTVVKDPFGNTTSYGYDTAGNQSTMVNAKGYKTTYNYNALNQLSSVVDPLGNTTQ